MESSVNSNTGNKQLLALVWLALRKGVAGVIASSNYLTATNPAPIGPSGLVVFSAPITTKVGKTVRVGVQISGSTSAIDTPVTIMLLRDGVPIGPTAVSLDSGHTDGKFTASIDWIDTLLAVGGPHTYAIQAAVAAGPTITIPTGGASIVLEERQAP